MKASKFIKCAAHCACAAIYTFLFLGFHAESLYLAAAAAYVLLAVNNLLN